MRNNQENKPLYFYVANLGSEVQRIFSWKEKGDKEAMQNAYKRATLIIDKIKSFKNENANKEMDILKHSLSNLISDKQEYVNRTQISAYFNPFALRVVNFI